MSDADADADADTDTDVGLSGPDMGSAADALVAAAAMAAPLTPTATVRDQLEKRTTPLMLLSIR
ncbi:hypothetical protein [Streptomyces sp. NPDC059063]|uniref:hypothetical protein n=1 Tax=unclassified Streptomyces TaxID=2593676 RepID=UPI003674DCC8